MTPVLIPTASGEEWHAARRLGVTASEIAVVMGLSPYSSPYALYWRKLGQLPEPEDTAAMDLGRFLEAWVAGRFQERHPQFEVLGDGRSLFAHGQRDWQLATPDRVLYRSLKNWDGTRELFAVLECKTSGSYEDWGDDGSGEIPVHYRCQLLWQMDVLGVTTGYVACLFLHSRQVRVYELRMDYFAAEDLKIMRREAARFLARLPEGEIPGVPPDVDWTPATAKALRRLHSSVEDVDVPVSSQLAGWYRAACRNLRKAEQRKALYENRIRAVLGGGRRAVDPGRGGQVVATRQVYDQRRIDLKLLRARYPETALECVTVSTVDKLVPAKPKDPNPS